MSEQHNECVIEGEAHPTWARPPVAAVVAVGCLLAAIVGMASTASPWLPNGGGDPSPPAIVGQVLAVALAVGLCLLMALTWIQTPERSKARRKSRDPASSPEEVGSSLRGSLLVLIGGILALAVLVAAFWVLLGQADPAETLPTSGEAIGGAGALPEPETSSPSAPAALDWFFVALIASTAIVLPLAFVVRRRRRVTDPVEEADDAPEAVVRAVGDSIDQIGRDTDARRAIIRAYARMEHALDDAGIPRRPYEAPFEYLGRALGVLRVSAPAAGRLADLFERARFSQHAVGAETKQEAIGALREVERQIQVPSS